MTQCNGRGKAHEMSGTEILVHIHRGYLKGLLAKN